MNRVIGIILFCSLLVWGSQVSFGQAGPEQMARLYAEAPESPAQGHCRFLIVPGADLQRAGELSAAAWKSIAADTEYQNIFLIRSAYGEPYSGVAVSGRREIATTSGSLEVNREISASLLASGRPFRQADPSSDPADKNGRQIPWISYRFGNVPRVVALEIGSSSVGTARDLALALLPYFNRDNLFVISSDFSHYPSWEDAKRVDGQTAEVIQKNDPAQFYSYLQEQSKSRIKNLSTPCSGWSSVLSLLYMSGREDILVKPLLYSNSGEAENGRKDRVVGYWAMAGYETAQDRNEHRINELEAEKLLEFARASIQGHLDTGTAHEMTCADSTASSPRGMIVRIFKHGIPRGCAMALDSNTSLCGLLKDLCLSAAFQDEDFYPLGAHELDLILLEITLIKEISPLKDPAEYNRATQGLLVREGEETRFFLPGELPPDLPGILSPDDGSVYIFEALVIRETADF